MAYSARMLLAQAVGEYGLMQSAAAGVQKVSFAARAFISDAGPATWALFGVVVVAGLWMLTRRRR
jgi:MYXO-CTERM domain-containing protein